MKSSNNLANSNKKKQQYGMMHPTNNINANAMLQG